MEKSFYYTVSWQDIGYLKVALEIMEVPFLIEQPSNRLQLSAGEVAFVFPELNVRVYQGVRELFNGHGKRYPY
ncbi:hypothetical protein P4U99_22370 [Brevibacillus agri]|uniref:hypothetical protein n=1 Tax=Brevibacillus TaxID=55080 RepID=UPI00203ED994|nr:MULTISPECIES: hypothetical protein [Brevibacillus]MCM3431696.1 hypothetical protein [Brevibacillus invocatus]MED1645897.1 hypothetical protein [Brevibacillus agri]MED1657594.1 hypothetical protein [Brevibacillus agri]MED1690086.1 hypothetical protein [Brevibacillus agri]MED1693997.1 hypothetical protein [Brevibacillus agri]